MPVITILAPKVEGADGESCMLSEITELPEAILSYIQGRVPTFKLKFSKTIGKKYFAGTCPKCGVLSGDFHLHSEPGAPFFPTTKRDAASPYMSELPIPGRTHARASIHQPRLRSINGHQGSNNLHFGVISANETFGDLLKILALIRHSWIIAQTQKPRCHTCQTECARAGRWR